MCDSESKGGDTDVLTSIVSPEDELLDLLGDTLGEKIDQCSDPDHTPDISSNYTNQSNNFSKNEDCELHLQSSPSSAIQNESICDTNSFLPNEQSPARPSVNEVLSLRVTELETLLGQEKLSFATLKQDYSNAQSKLSVAITERDAYLIQLKQTRDRCSKLEEDGQAVYDKRLQELSAQLSNVTKQAKDRDQMARNAIANLKQESSQRITELQKQLETATKEKDLMVVRFAEGETKVIMVENEKVKLTKSLSDMTRDREQLLGKVKAMRDEKMKMQQQLDVKQTEVTNIHKEVDRHIENFRQAEQKSRWLQGKMAADSEGTGELKQKIERLNIALKDSKEESDKSKKHYESIIRDYQKKEEEKISDLTVRDQEKEVKRIIDEQLMEDKQKTEVTLKKELESAEQKQKELNSENQTLKQRMKIIEEEKQEIKSQINNIHEELVGKRNSMTQLSETLKSLKHQNDEKEKEICQKRTDLTAAMEKVSELESRINDMKNAYEESHIEVDNYSARNAELLSFTEKVSSKNSQLLSEMSSLKTQLSSVSQEKYELHNVKTEQEECLTKIKSQYGEVITKSNTEKDSFETELKVKKEMIEKLQQEVEDGKNDIKVMKKKHALAIKELNREIHGAASKKLIDGHIGNSTGSGGSSDTVGGGCNGNLSTIGSRTGSMTSLENIAGAVPSRSKNATNNRAIGEHHDLTYYNSNRAAISVDSFRGDRMNDHTPNSYPEIAVVDIDKSKLVEKIVKLQKAHARKNEKMELMEEQINTLMSEVGKKDRIIQHYALREETGAVSSERSDHIKSQLSKKGGSVMGSVFSAQHDGAMTLDLSLEINRKLQALLEDTLLKNMTLKENLETLGEEIANLSRSNRELKMELQIYKKISNTGS